MIFFEADVDIPVKAKMEEVRLIRVSSEEPFSFMKEYRPEKEDYILITCTDGWVVIALPKD
jgi:hypothetical protein